MLWAKASSTSAGCKVKFLPDFPKPIWLWFSPVVWTEILWSSLKSQQWKWNWVPSICTAQSGWNSVTAKLKLWTLLYRHQYNKSIEGLRICCSVVSLFLNLLFHKLFHLFLKINNNGSSRGLLTTHMGSPVHLEKPHIPTQALQSQHCKEAKRNFSFASMLLSKLRSADVVLLKENGTAWHSTHPSDKWLVTHRFYSSHFGKKNKKKK